MTNDRRIHIGLGVRDVGRSIDFYRAFFGREPTKVRPGYAKFEVADPSVNLSMIEVAGATGPSNAASHFGIQVKSREAVAAAAKRLAAAGLRPRIEERVDCCYAVQDKAWVTDPDGHSWEVFVVTQAESGRRTTCCRT